MTNYTTDDLEQRGLAEMAYERDLAAQTARAETAEARAAFLAAEVATEHEAATALAAVIGKIAEAVGVPVSSPELSRLTVARAAELAAEVERLQDALDGNDPRSMLEAALFQMEDELKAAQAELAALRGQLAARDHAACPHCGQSLQGVQLLPY